MSKKEKKEIDLLSYEDILGETGQIMEIPLSELHEFRLHPFQVREDGEFSDLVKSIAGHGVLTPGVARKRPEGGYELISGHRRRKACEKLGLKTMPIIVKDFSDDEAAVLVVDSNIQRRTIFHSEKAKAYALKYEALRHQGRNGGSSLDAISEFTGENPKTVQRYIWLSRLNDGLLEKVDGRQILFTAGIELSFLSPAQQKLVLDVINETEYQKLTKQQAQKIKDAAEKNALTEDAIKKILSVRTVTTVKNVFDYRDLSLDFRKLEHYFGKNFDQNEAEEIIFELLDRWKEDSTSGHGVQK